MTAGARDRAIRGFLDGCGWGGATIEPLAADASFRRYLRARRAAATAVVMDAPPDREPVAPFAALARHLRGLGFSAPDVLAADGDAGLLLLEDLGDATFSRILARGGDEAALYRRATDALVALHRVPADRAIPPGLARYDDDSLAGEAALLVDWYAPAVLGEAPGAAARARYDACWRSAFPHCRSAPETLVLRDYHVDNLIWLDGRDGVAACGMVDFQDAVAGPASYDFVSLVEDARRDVPPALAREMRARYLAAFPSLDPPAFDASCAVLGAQRHCKVLGIFTRLCMRDGKPGYLRHIPRVWRMLEAALDHPVLAPVREWIDDTLPASARVVPDRRRAA